MRFAVVFAAALCLSGCTFMKEQLPWTQPAPPPPVPQQTPAPKPAPPKPHPRVEQPAPQQPAAPAAPAPLRGDVAPVESTADQQARCRAMADNRAGDAKELGASPADQTKMRDDTFHDCMEPAVK